MRIFTINSLSHAEKPNSVLGAIFASNQLEIIDYFRDAMKNSRLFATLLCAFALAGCARTEPVKNINQTLNTHYSDSQLQTAILDAGRARQWVMQPQQPGVINGRIIQRNHSADIRITYGANHYSINYVGSNNLMAAPGEIHRNYNRWVNNLDKDIQLRLASSKTP